MGSKPNATLETSNEAIALREDGSVFLWRDGIAEAKLLALEFGRVVKIDAGANHFIALFEDGRIAVWPTLPTQRKSISISACFLGPCPQGKRSPNPYIPPSILPAYLTQKTGAIDIAAADNVNAAVFADGTVHIWGKYAEDFTPPFELKDIVEISLTGIGGDDTNIQKAGTQALAKNSQGEIFTWGNFGATTQSADQLSNIKEIFPGLGWLTQAGELFDQQAAYTRGVRTDRSQPLDPVIKINKASMKYRGLLEVLEGESGNIYAYTVGEQGEQAPIEH